MGYRMSSSTSQFLSFTVSSRKGGKSQHLRLLQSGLVGRWLTYTKVGYDATGDVIRVLRQRRDLPNSFPTKGHMRRYLLRFMKPVTIDPVFDNVWSMYRDWVAQARHSNEATE